MRSKFLVLCLAAAFCLCLGACDSDTNAPSTAKDKSADADTARWNAYVSLSNESAVLMEIFSRYPDVLGRNAEPDISGNLERFTKRVGENDRFFNRINDTETAKVLEQAAASKQEPLDAAAKAFAENVRTTLALQKEAQQYYAAKSYVDDKLAKGKEMHPKILAAYDALTASYETFSDLMSARDRVNILRNIEKMQKDGMKALPAALEFLVVAQDAASKMPREGAVDPAALKPEYDKMVQALAKITAVSTDEEQLKKERLYKDKVQFVAKTAGELKAHLTSQLEFASSGQQRKPKMGESPERFRLLLDRYITGYNYMIEARP